MNRSHFSHAVLLVAGVAQALAGGSALAHPDDDQALIEHGRSPSSP